MAFSSRLARFVSLFALAAALAGTAQAADRETRLANGEARAKELLTLMDQDRNGKVSKQEFMDFMAAEFDRLDINKDGALDVEELTGIRIRRSTPHHHAK